VATDCVKLLATLIEHKTVNPGGDEIALARLLGEKLEAVGADSVEVCELTEEERDGGESGAYVWGVFGTPRTLINVHLDTVPVTTGWTRDPFTLTQEDDRLYGLGSADTKGAIACVLTALAAEKPRDVAILFSGDEERRSRCMAAFLATGLGADIARAIVCEPTDRQLGVRHRGIRAYQFETHGAGGHSSSADRTEKPNVVIAKLALELDALGERYLEETGASEMPGLCLNIAELAGGVAFNVIPERARLSLSVRPGPGFDVARFEGELGTAIRAAAASAPIEMERVLARASFATRDAASFVDLVGDAPRQHTSLDFWTEAALLSEAGIDAVVIGPGNIAVAHAPDEYVTASDLEWATAMFESMFRNSSP